MRNYFTYGDINSLDYGLYIDGWNKDKAPERDIEAVVIPGRNGTLTIDKGRFANIDIPYKCYVDNNAVQRIDALKNALLAQSGYVRLEDTYHPDVYRMARYKGGLTPTLSQELKRGYFDITFDCMPQQFLKIGEQTQTFTATGTIINPTMQKAKPMLRIYGTGSLILNGFTITVTTANTYTDIDCEIMEAYKGTVNCNANVTLPDEIYLSGGSNAVVLSGITQVDIIPKWWEV